MLPKFMGEYLHALDPKGRVVLPASFRQHLEGGLVITIGIDRCLTVHTPDAWERVAENLRTLPTTDARARKFVRMLWASAHPDTLDRQGRVTIPTRLREYAHLERDVMVVGADQGVNLWDSATWETYSAEGLDAFAETDEPFAAGGPF